VAAAQLPLSGRGGGRRRPLGGGRSLVSALGREREFLRRSPRGRRARGYGAARPPFPPEACLTWTTTTRPGAGSAWPGTRQGGRAERPPLSRALPDGANRS
jgi:hypothetical protein